MSCFLNLFLCLLPSPGVCLYPCSSAAPKSGKNLLAEVSSTPNRAKHSLPVSYRWRSWSHHAEFFLFTTDSDCWLGLCFIVIPSCCAAVTHYSLFYLCVWFFLLNCSSLHFPPLSFSLWISGHSPTLPFWSVKISSVLGVSSYWCHLLINCETCVCACVCSLACCLDPSRKARLRLGWR